MGFFYPRSSAWSSKCLGQSMIAKIDGRSLDDPSGVVDNEMEPTVAQKECQPYAPEICAFSALMPAGYLAFSNERLDNRRVNTKPLANDRGIDLHFVVFEFDRGHHQSLLRRPFTGGHLLVRPPTSAGDCCRFHVRFDQRCCWLIVPLGSIVAGLRLGFHLCNPETTAGLTISTFFQNDDLAFNVDVVVDPDDAWRSPSGSLGLLLF